MVAQLELNFAGIRLRAEDPGEVARWLAETLAAPCRAAGDSWLVTCPGIEIRLSAREADPPLQQAAEGYYTGLAHIALRSTDLPGTVRLCAQRGIALAGGQAVSHNPGIWGTGMDYVNPLCPFGFGLEFCQRLDLPAAPMTVLQDGLEHIGIPVPEIGRSTAFYQTLGFVRAAAAEIRREDGQVIHCVMMQGGGVTLELFEFAGMDHEPYRDQPFEELVFETEDPRRWARERSLQPEEEPGGALRVHGPGGEVLRIEKRGDRDGRDV